MNPGAATDSKEADAGPTKYECRICWYLFDPAEGDPFDQIPAGTAFAELPGHWRCPQCDAEQFSFLPIDE